MSAYITFYVRKDKNIPVPLLTYCRSTRMYSAATSVAVYGETIDVTKSLGRIETCLLDAREECEKAIKETNESINFLKTLDYPIDKVLSAQRDLYDTIEEAEEYKREIDTALAELHVFKEIAEDNFLCHEDHSISIWLGWEEELNDNFDPVIKDETDG